MHIPEEEWNLPLTLMILWWMIQTLAIFLGYGVASALRVGFGLGAVYVALYFLARWIVRRLS